jgi:hypothetical protein
MSNPHQRQTQASTSNTVDDVEVGNGATRYDWSIAFTPMCMRKEYPAIAIATAMRLVEELPRKRGQCDPLRDDMAVELGRDIRTIDRGYQVLEADGWITRHRAGRRTVITFLIPSVDADIHRFGNKSGVGSRDIQVSRQDDDVTRHKTGSDATQNASSRDIYVSRTKEQEVQKEQSAASPRASEYADRVGPAIKQNGASVPRARAPGALRDDVDTWSDDRALAWLERNPTSTVYASS